MQNGCGNVQAEQLLLTTFTTYFIVTIIYLLVIFNIKHANSCELNLSKTAILLKLNDPVLGKKTFDAI